MINRPASNIYFILHGKLQSKKIILWYSMLRDSCICDVVSQFNDVAERGRVVTQGIRTAKTKQNRRTMKLCIKYTFTISVEYT